MYTCMEADDFIKIDSTSIKFNTKDSEFEKYVEIFGYSLVFNHSLVEVEVVNEFSLLLTVHGSDPTLKPYLLTAHMDVVPVDPDQWSLPPFLGKVVKDPETGEPAIWGRGALDNKSGVIGILSALDLLFKKNWKPLRTFYVGFGHDEEVTGKDGAGHIGKTLSERNAQIDFLLDEGTPILSGVMQGVDSPVALIAVTEKGRMEVKLTAEGVAGHSSFPPKKQAVEILSRAITNLYKYPQPSMFGSGPEADMLRYLAPRAKWPHKLLFSNLWLFGPLISYAMSLKRETNAMIKTTTAVTILNAGYKNNVIPGTATAHINHRVHPSQSLKDVLAHDTAVIGDSEVKIELLEGTEPQPVSPYGPDSIPYNLIAGAIREAYPEAITIPGLLIANTDTVHYLHLTSNVYRFSPTFVTIETLGTLHGKNERVTVSSFISNVLFYKSLILLADEIHKNVSEFKPGLLIGNTDTRYYLQLTPNVYRFNPALVTLETFRTFHGNDERIALSSSLIANTDTIHYQTCIVLTQLLLL
ncbi:putative carboxypeptidase PM20D1 [Armadillidium vulgare]|nr:putative carboxypeptidase PM20D1 [Armadillidium vulgare]